MTAAELRALLEKATPGNWEVTECGHLMAGDKFVVDYFDRDEDAALIVALRNNAERFAELLAAEEARSKPKPLIWSGTDAIQVARFDSDRVAAVCPATDPEHYGEWFWDVYDSVCGYAASDYKARAAVEDAVRAGR